VDEIWISRAGGVVSINVGSKADEAEAGTPPAKIHRQGRSWTKRSTGLLLVGDRRHGTELVDVGGDEEEEDLEVILVEHLNLFIFSIFLQGFFLQKADKMAKKRPLFG